jgi:hypothetical protein
MTFSYQRFTAVSIYGSLYVASIIVSVFWCPVMRTLELELERRTNIKFLVKLGKSGSEMLVQVYGDNAMKKTSVY